MAVSLGVRALLGGRALVTYEFTLAQASVSSMAALLPPNQVGGTLSAYRVPWAGHVIGLAALVEDGFDGLIALTIFGSPLSASWLVSRSGSSINGDGFLRSPYPFSAGSQIGLVVASVTTAADIHVQLYVALDVEDGMV